MRLKQKKLFLGILIFGLITNSLVLFGIQYFYLRAIFSFILLTIIPGFLIMLMLKIRKIGFWEYLVYTIGLSIAFLMFAGLTINWILPRLHITDEPLSLIPLLISFNVGILIFGIIAYIRNKDILLNIELPKLNWFNKIFFIVPVISPILSILGAITLNNGGSNYFTMIMLGGIGIYVFLIILFRNRLNEHVFPWAILLTSVSLLLMFSLRGWHIFASGDIGQEYLVFQLAKNNNLWKMSLFKDPYNACLSLSILPTYLSYFLKISDEYVFKLIYPLIFSFSSIGIYLLINKIFKEKVAYLATFLFVSSPYYYSEMSILMRQEIAVLFFIILLLTIFSNKNNKRSMEYLFCITGVSMAVSHYSTAYIGYMLLILAYILLLILRRYRKNYSKNIQSDPLESITNIHQDYSINIYIVIILSIFTLIWYSQASLTNKNSIIGVFTDTLSNLKTTFTNESRAEGTSLFDQFKFVRNPENHETMLHNYYNGIFELNMSHNSNDYYKSTTFEKYKIFEISQKRVPININPKIATLLFFVLEFIKKLIYIFIMVGYILILYLGKDRLNIFYLALLSATILLLGIMSVLPYVTYVYPFERLYQQMLIVLSVPAVVGGLFLLNIGNRPKKYWCVCLILIIYFWYSTGFLQQIIGGFQGNINLNNYGNLYSSAYTSKAEIYSILWMKHNSNLSIPIYTDQSSTRKIYAYAEITNGIVDGVIPPNIQRESYVYANQSGFTSGDALVLYKGTYLHYNFPLDFLNINKNLVYNNKASAIFR